MRENNKWRSLSIMDLHLNKRGSFATTSGLSTSSSTSSSSSKPGNSQQQDVPLTNNGQSYELIKSTQVRIYFILESLESE